MPRSDEARIGDILEAGRRSAAHIGSHDRESFDCDHTIVSAVLFELAVIGEASKGLSEVARARYGDVPWADMAKMRDIVIHQYFGIDLSIVWNVARVKVPAVLVALSHQT